MLQAKGLILHPGSRDLILWMYIVIRGSGSGGRIRGREYGLVEIVAEDVWLSNGKTYSIICGI